MQEGYLKKAEPSSNTSSLLQNEWTEAVDAGGRDGSPGANGDGS